MGKQKGIRVGAIVDESATVVRMFGYGLYAGEEVPPREVIFQGKRYCDIAPGKKNPKIILDNGKAVYGCECYWGPEKDIKARIGSRIVSIVDVDDYRKQGLESLTGEDSRPFSWYPQN